MNILPTRASLSRFVPNMDSSYPICGHQLETLIHLLWTCPLARALWFNSAWGIKTDSFQLDSPIQLIKNLISPSVSLNLNRNQTYSFLLCGSLILEQVWSMRNIMVHADGVFCLDKYFTSIQNHFVEHQDMHPNHYSSSSPQVQVRWSKPEEG